VRHGCDRAVTARGSQYVTQVWKIVDVTYKRESRSTYFGESMSPSNIFVAVTTSSRVLLASNEAISRAPNKKFVGYIKR
jgi:hypothetical protein